jgi:hypothetical protein
MRYEIAPLVEDVWPRRVLNVYSMRQTAFAAPKYVVTAGDALMINIITNTLP